MRREWQVNAQIDRLDEESVFHTFADDAVKPNAHTVDKNPGSAAEIC